MLDLWFQFQGSAAVICASLLDAMAIGNFAAVCLIAVLTGIVFVWLYSFVSFQKALTELKRKITAAALEPFLFRESLRVSIIGPLKLTVLSLKYFALSLPPLVILAVPMIWLLGIVNQSLGYEKAEVGDRLFVTVQALSPKEIRNLELASELQGFELSPLVRAPARAEAYAELRAVSAGQSGNLIFKLKSESLTLPIYGLPPLPVISSSFWKRLVFPGGRIKLPAGLKEVSVEYPVKYFNIFGLNLHWVVIFLLISILAGLIFAKISGIEV